MLSAVTMIQAINESVSNGYITESTVPAMAFHGLDAVEACYASRNAVLTEAVDFYNFCQQTDEIMVEAALSNPSSLEILQENVFENMASKAKKIFDKIIAAVKGLWERIKASFYKLFGKTKKWYEVMKKRVEEAKKTNSYRAHITYDMHDWNTSYMSKEGMPSKLDDLISDWKEAYDKKKAADFKTEYSSPYSGSLGAKDSEPDAQLKKDLSAAKEDKSDEENEKLLDDVNRLFGVGGADLSAAYDEIRKKCTNDKSEKESVKVSGNVDTYMTAVKGSNDQYTKLEKAYKKYLNELTKAKEALVRASNSSVKVENEKEKNSENMTTMREIVSAKIQAGIKITERYHAAITQIQSIHLTMFNTMINEYMGAVTAYCNGKPKKDED